MLWTGCPIVPRTACLFYHGSLAAEVSKLGFTYDHRHFECNSTGCRQTPIATATPKPASIPPTTKPSPFALSFNSDNPLIAHTPTMNAGEAAHGLSLVPSTGANEVDLHEFVDHVEGNRIMKTQGYVVNASGWVDPSTLARHRYVVLEIEHRSVSGTPLCTYFIRIDRRAERHVSSLKFVRRLGNVKSSDRVRSRTESAGIKLTRQCLGCAVI